MKKIGSFVCFEFSITDLFRDFDFDSTQCCCQELPIFQLHDQQKNIRHHVFAYRYTEQWQEGKNVLQAELELRDELIWKQMPLVGFGLWKVNNDTCADQVYNAIKTGYRLFDGACDYGNEKECGEGVARALKDGLCKREDLFLVSKLW